MHPPPTEQHIKGNELMTSKRELRGETRNGEKLGALGEKLARQMERKRIRNPLRSQTKLINFAPHPHPPAAPSHE